MKNISLINVSILVVTAAFVSNFVNAEDKLTKSKNEQVKYSDLIANLDTDKNGLLSQTETLASKNKVLQGTFKKIDLNGDEQISEQEFNHFVTLKNSKEALITKNAS